MSDYNMDLGREAFRKRLDESFKRIDELLAESERVTREINKSFQKQNKLFEDCEFLQKEIDSQINNLL